MCPSRCLARKFSEKSAWLKGLGVTAFAAWADHWNGKWEEEPGWSGVMRQDPLLTTVSTTSTDFHTASSTYPIQQSYPIATSLPPAVRIAKSVPPTHQSLTSECGHRVTAQHEAFALYNGMGWRKRRRSLGASRIARRGSSDSGCCSEAEGPHDRSIPSSLVTSEKSKE